MGLNLGIFAGRLLMKADAIETQSEPPLTFHDTTERLFISHTLGIMRTSKEHYGRIGGRERSFERMLDGWKDEKMGDVVADVVYGVLEKVLWEYECEGGMYSKSRASLDCSHGELKDGGI